MQCVTCKAELDGASFASHFREGCVNFEKSLVAPELHNSTTSGLSVTDDSGNAFVLDQENQCISKYVPAGQSYVYMGMALQEYLNVGKLETMGWNGATSSLIVAHEKDGQWFLSQFNVANKSDEV